MNPNDPNVPGNQGMPINPLPSQPLPPQQPAMLPQQQNVPPQPPVPDNASTNIGQTMPVAGATQTPFQPPPPPANVSPVEPLPQNNAIVPQPTSYQDPAQPALSPDPSKVVGSFDQPQPTLTNNLPNTAPQQPIAQGGNSSFLGQQSKRPNKKVIMIVVTTLLLLIVIGGGYFAFTKFMGGTKLEKFSNSHFSIKYPKGYEKDESEYDAEFTEPNSEEKTKSYIIVTFGESNEEINDKLLEKEFKVYESDINAQVSDELRLMQKVENGKSERINHKGSKALKVTADVTENGKKIGTAHLLLGVNKKQYFLVLLYAHNSDPGVEKKADAILASFDLK